MGIELELATLFGLHVLGTSLFGRFEAETAWWRLTLKWTIVTALTLVAYRFFGHVAMAVIALPAVAGGVFHFAWCRRHGIHPIEATPRRTYYDLRGWTWPE